MRQDYRAWLERQKYDPRTIGTQCSRINRVEENYGDLAKLFTTDRLRVRAPLPLKYSAEDKRRNAAQSLRKLQINGDRKQQPRIL